MVVRATSHTRLRAHYYCTSSTLIGGKDGAGPSSLHTMLEGPLHGIEWIMLHGHLDYFQKSPLGGRSNTKPRDHGTPNAHNR